MSNEHFVQWVANVLLEYSGTFFDCPNVQNSEGLKQFKLCIPWTFIQDVNWLLQNLQESVKPFILSKDLLPWHGTGGYRVTNDYQLRVLSFWNASAPIFACGKEGTRKSFFDISVRWAVPPLRLRCREKDTLSPYLKKTVGAHHKGMSFYICPIILEKMFTLKIIIEHPEPFISESWTSENLSEPGLRVLRESQSNRTHRAECWKNKF